MNNPVTRVLVTGASGFIGTAVCKRLLSEGLEVVAVLRQRTPPLLLENIRTAYIENIDGHTDWQEAITGVDAVVHLAARVHVMADKSLNPIRLYRQINVDGTRNLAEQAMQAGVKRFLFLSSVKVNGEENTKAYTESDEASPEDDYGISKMEAELQLAAIAGRSDMEHVIIRPPLVYGPGVKANFLALVKLVDRNIPLPIGSVTNRRSFIYLGNLVDSIHRCLTHPAAAGQTYLVSDGRDVSTPNLVRLIANALERRCFLMPFPSNGLRAMARFLGKEQAMKRLLESLTVEIKKMSSDLDWVPPFSMESGLRDTAKWFKEIIRTQ